MISSFINIFLSSFNDIYFNLISNGFSFEIIFISLFIFDILIFIILKLVIDLNKYRRFL